MRGHLQRSSARREGIGQPVAPAVPVLFGKNGLAWGSGLAGQNENGLRKAERDGRAPAGIFRIGKIYTYDAQLPAGADYPFHQVTTADAWIDDVKQPGLQSFCHDSRSRESAALVRETKNAAQRFCLSLAGGDPAQFRSARARRGQRDIFSYPARSRSAEAGCTTMAESDLVKLITWLRAPRHPCYVLLPAAEYDAKWQNWHLPPPESGRLNR